MTEVEYPWRDESPRCDPYRKQELRMRSRVYNPLRGTAEGDDGVLTDHICDYCGESFATSNELGGHVTVVHRRDHHLLPRKFFVGPDGQFDHEQANRVSNLVTVCSKHHLIREDVAPQRLDTIVDATRPPERGRPEGVALPLRGDEG